MLVFALRLHSPTSHPHSPSFFPSLPLSLSLPSSLPLPPFLSPSPSPYLSNAGYRKILVFFLVDPTQRILSTKDVAPQQVRALLLTVSTSL